VNPSAFAAAAAVVAGALVALSCGCSGDSKAVREVEAAFDSGDYRETVALCRHAIRRNEAEARVYYYYGAALIEMDRDFEAFRQFDEAAARDPALGIEASAWLSDKAADDFRAWRRRRAAERMRKAAELDPARALGGYQYLVADLYFQEEQWEDAVRLYRGALAAAPDTSEARTAMFNLAVALERAGSTAAAREAYETLLETWPRGRHRVEARWRLANLCFEEGQRQYDQGNFEAAIEQLVGMEERTDNQGLLQRSRFLLGEAYEAVGDLENAYRQYQAVIDSDRGASGRVVQRARAKVDALREAGLN
jgi:outer membrane protein assembly factor BamD (BamD/ComL family)